MMPRVSGYDVARALADKPSTSHIPIIFVTAKTEMEDRVFGLEMAVDYVCKPFAAPELLARVRAALRVRRLQDELRVSNEQLARLAVTDSLTGLSNRRSFNQRIENELRRAQRFGHSLALVMFDLDLFKEVNDTWGHPQGDTVLQAFSQVLRHSSRRIDTVARIGGEEFAAILPATDEALSLPIRGRESAIEGEDIISITVSSGVAVVTGLEDGQTPVLQLSQALSQAADQLLYAAKQAGRNRVMVQTFVGDEMNGTSKAPVLH